VDVRVLAVLPPDPRTPREARRLLREFLAPVAHGEVADAVVLAVSELVTNAVEHAGTRVELRAGTEGACLRIEVADGSGDMPRERLQRPDAVGGRGLHMVEQLADRWDVMTTPTGKTVWFERTLGGIDAFTPG
jgi:anti-sigma regulatory factor (Ser/Thr protein kinase)